MTLQLAGQRWYGGEKVIRVEPIGRVGPAEHALVHVNEGPPYQVFLDDSGRDILTEPEVACEFVDATESVRPLGAEQSNTSLVFDEELLVKVFRRVADGPNPDVEVPGALSGEPGAPVLIPRFIRQWFGRDLAVGTRFLPNAVEGLTVFRNEADPSASAGELGRVLAELHIAVARRLPTAEATPAAWSAARSEALDAGLPLAEPNGARSWGLLIRVHGDLHLGQVLRDSYTCNSEAERSARGNWWIVDFEGEPLRPLEERRRPASPLKDVAGMLRSFAYARVLAERDASWEQAASDHFVDAYLGTPGVRDLLPDPIEPVLDLHVAEKALYELRYERTYRPEWAWIPEEALTRMRKEHQ